MRLGDAREVGSSREVLADQAVGVFVAAALPGTSRVAEVDLHLGGDRKALVRMHLLALVPRQRTSQLLRQFADVLGKRRNDRRDWGHATRVSARCRRASRMKRT